MNRHEISCDECQKIIVSSIIDHASPVENLPAVIHAAHCQACSRLADEYRALTAEFHAASRPKVKPGPVLRSKWTAAVMQEAKSQSHEPLMPRRIMGETIYRKFLVEISLFIQKNLRPLSAIIPIWFFILIFHVTSPKVESIKNFPHNVTAHDIVRIFQTQDHQDWLGDRMEKPKSTDEKKPA